MQKLKLLNKSYLSIIIFFFSSGFALQSQEPIDIWNVEAKQQTENASIIENFGKKSIPKNSVYEMQSQKINELNVEEDQTLESEKIKIVGLYDPAENGLDINMWSNSNGDQILNIFKRINKINLSSDAAEILDILLLTNAHYPELNITKKNF